MRIRINLWIIAALMAAQALLGLFADVYRDTGWIRDTWLGNDLITLGIAVPVFAASIASWRRIGRILSLGVLGYSIYNYAYYLLGAEINSQFPLYVALMVLSIIGLASILSTRNELHAEFDTPPEGRGFVYPAAIFIFIGVGLGAVWLLSWAGYILLAKPLPQSSTVFRLVASLDLVLMAFPLVAGGILLLRRSRFGFLISAIIGVQAFLYLLVLCLNSALISIKAGAFPGELPVWAALLAIEGSGILLFLARMRKEAS